MRNKALYGMMIAAFVAGCLVVKGVSAGEAKEAKKGGKAEAAATGKKEAVETKVEAPKEAAEAKAEAKTEDAAPAQAAGPEFIKLEKVGKQAPVNFPHAAHGKRNKCDDCHGGDKPLFAQKVSGKGMLMKDIYAGKSCGTCHDGKKAFKAMGGCAKCHKKEAAEAKKEAK